MLTSDDIASTRLVVGLEIHVELATRTKMFSRVENPAYPSNYDAEPNTLVDPVVAALPGTLPRLNRQAVEMSARVGLALGCSISSYSKWDRKNYSYPDLPKGYQISQYDLPLCFDGSVECPSVSTTSDGGVRRIGIIRAHLEEDTGKLSHEFPGGGPCPGSLLDLNRAGTPLLEIVTLPDFDCAQDVVAFARELRSICRFLGVTEGIMQRGHMRFEPNVNVIIDTRDGHEFRTPIVEIKNLNSFRALLSAIEFESIRQVDEFLETGREMGPGMKQTRGWDDERNVTVLQREKEDAHDYRYFPEPDLIPVELDPAWIEETREGIPELPLARRRRYMEDLSLSDEVAHAIVEEREHCLYFEHASDALAARGLGESHAASETAKILLNQVAHRANETGVGWHEIGVAPQRLAEIVHLRVEGRIGPQSVLPMLELAAKDDRKIELLAQESGQLVVRDEGTVERWIEEAIAAEPKAAEDVAAGKDAAIGRLLGHIMKVSAGQADASEVSKQLIKRLRS